MLCTCGDMLLDQQVHVIKPTRLTNRLKIHKTRKYDLADWGT